MTEKKNEREFIPLNITVLTISDSRTQETDKSGNKIVALIEGDGHNCYEKKIVLDDKYAIRAEISHWIANEEVQVVLTTGGTGITGRDGTPEAVNGLFDKNIDGFGETFRAISFQQIKTSTMQFLAIAGVANGTYIFCMPGSMGACKTAWEELIRHQLDYRTRPCNLVELMPRLREV